MGGAKKHLALRNLFPLNVQDDQTTKIMHLENLALYGWYSSVGYVHAVPVVKCLYQLSVVGLCD